MDESHFHEFKTNVWGNLMQNSSLIIYSIRGAVFFIKSKTGDIFTVLVTCSIVMGMSTREDGLIYGQFHLIRLKVGSSLPLTC